MKFTTGNVTLIKRSNGVSAIKYKASVLLYLDAAYETHEYVYAYGRTKVEAHKVLMDMIVLEINEQMKKAA